MPGTYLEPVGTTAEMKDNLLLTHLEDLLIYLKTIRKVLIMEQTKEMASADLEISSYQLIIEIWLTRTL